MAGERFTGNQRVGMILGILLVVALFITASWWLLTPSREPLFAQTLSEENQAEVLAHLMQWGTTFEQEEGTGTILVDAEQVSSLRSKFGAIGIPSRENAGLELFDKGDYGMSEFAQRINYQRALEGELARSIRAFDEVRFARVHLTLAKNSLFESRKEPAKASVIIQLKPNKSISDEQVGGIQQLVAGAVPGLNAEQVAVIDEAGRSLGGDQASAPRRQGQNASAIEQEFEHKALRLLAGLFPEESIYVSVRASLNHDRVRSVREEIIPAQGGNSGYVVKKRDQLTALSNQNEPEKRVTPTSNGTEVEYTFSKERSEIEKATGTINQLSIGVVIKGVANPDLIKTAESVLRSGLGLNESRGDQLVIASTPTVAESVVTKESILDDSFGVKHAEETTASESKLAPELSWSWILLPVFVVIVLLVWMLRRHQQKPALTGAAVLSVEDKERLLRDIRHWIHHEEANV